MLNDNGNKTAKKISRSNKQKNNYACAAHFLCTFLYHCFAIYRRNAQVLEMQNFTLAYMKGWMYIQTYGRFTSNTYPSLEPKFL